MATYFIDSTNWPAPNPIQVIESVPVDGTPGITDSNIWDIVDQLRTLGLVDDASHTVVRKRGDVTTVSS